MRIAQLRPAHRLFGISKRASRAARKRVRFQPQFSCRDGRIDPRLPPPCYFVAAAVNLAVVAATQGNGELVADFAAERPALAIAQMMGIARLATANQARMLGDVPDVVAVLTRRGSGNAPASVWKASSRR